MRENRIGEDIPSQILKLNPNRDNFAFHNINEIEPKVSETAPPEINKKKKAIDVPKTL